MRDMELERRRIERDLHVDTVDGAAEEPCRSRHHKGKGARGLQVQRGDRGYILELASWTTARNVADADGSAMEALRV